VVDNVGTCSAGWGVIAAKVIVGTEQSFLLNFDFLFNLNTELSLV